jgi:hypothetical protein
MNKKILLLALLLTFLGLGFVIINNHQCKPCEKCTEMPVNNQEILIPQEENAKNIKKEHVVEKPVTEKVIKKSQLDSKKIDTKKNNEKKKKSVVAPVLKTESSKKLVDSKSIKKQ